MYEYEILNKTTGERSFVWGYSWKDAMHRAKLEDKAVAGQVICLCQEYVD